MSDEPAPAVPEKLTMEEIAQELALLQARTTDRQGNICADSLLTVSSRQAQALKQAAATFEMLAPHKKELATMLASKG